MKKILTILFCLISLTTFSQTKGLLNKYRKELSKLLKEYNIDSSIGFSKKIIEDKQSITFFYFSPENELEELPQDCSLKKDTFILNSEYRIIENIETIMVYSDTLNAILYDNGIIDGDTISLYVNKKKILNKKELTAEPLEFKIYFEKNEETIEVIFIAENLGKLPPNTGLLIIYDGKKRYEVRFSGDMKKNSSIILKKLKKSVSL